MRPLPADLATALRRAREVESAAATRAQRLAAVHATSALIHIARAEGWTARELALGLNMKQSTLRRRLGKAPDREAQHGLVVTPPPPPAHRAPPLPVDQREWLSLSEACELAGVAPSCMLQWRGGGLLPASTSARRRYRYSRADVTRIMNAPRKGGQGVDWASVRALIAEEHPRA